MKKLALSLLVILSTLSCNNGKNYDVNARTAYNCAMRMYCQCDSIYNNTSREWANALLSTTPRHTSKEAAQNTLDRLANEYRDSGILDTLNAYRERLLDAMASLADPPAEQLECLDNLQTLANDVILMQTLVTHPKEAHNFFSYKEQVEILEQDIIKKSNFFLTHCINN